MAYDTDPFRVNVSGLTNGDAYELQVRAMNEIGPGPAPVAPVTTPATTPEAPLHLTAKAGDGFATLSFTAPSDNGGADITGYQSSIDGGDTWSDLTVTDRTSTGAHSPRTMPVLTATLKGLKNGTTYDVQVRAVNSMVPAVRPRQPRSRRSRRWPSRSTGRPAKAVTEGSTVTISGKAPAGSTVQIFFRKRGDASFVLRRTLVATQTNTFSTSYVATEDYRHYAQIADTKTDSMLAQIAPTVTGPDSQSVKRNSSVTIHGTGTPGSTVKVHFHKAGAPLNDYSIVREVAVSSSGTWSRAYVATVDYRFHVTSDANGLSTHSYLVQASLVLTASTESGASFGAPAVRGGFADAGARSASPWPPPGSPHPLHSKGKKGITL